MGNEAPEKAEEKLTLEEFGERVKVAGLNPMRDAFNEYVARIRAIGKSFLEALEDPPKTEK